MCKVLSTGLLKVLRSREEGLSFRVEGLASGPYGLCLKGMGLGLFV